MNQILSGYKVLDFGHYIPGPYTAMLLAEQGAEVIKIERPGGDPYRSEPGFRVLNRSKKGIVLDLKNKKNQRIAQDLSRDADVIIENFRPGVADRLGIGYDTIHRMNPRAIYLSISGFGQKGPYRDRPGWEELVCATTGSYIGQAGGENFPPNYLALPLASTYAALMAAYSTTMALYARETTGIGQKVDVSLLGSLLCAGTSGYLDFKDRVFMQPLHTPQGRSPVYRLYQGSDKKWFFIALGNMAFITKFAIAMDHDEWLIDDRFEGAPFMIEPPYSEEIAVEFQALFSERTRDEWLTFLRAEDIPCAPADPVTTFIDDPQVAANDMVVEIEDPDLGKGRQMGIPVKFSRTPGAIQGRAPRLGEHTEMIVSGSRNIPTDTVSPEEGEKVPPLEGLKVLDITTMLNGPYCAMLLSEMGADVTKIEPPDGDPWRVMGGGFVGVNRGKRSISLDMKTDKGRRIAHDLVAQADILIENTRWGVCQRLGMDYETIAKINPEIIYLSILAYGTTGPLRELPGYDPLLQARSGQMVTQGGLGKPPVFHAIPINDMAGPMLGAFGVALALLEKSKGGMGQYVQTSLANAAVAMQAHQFLDYVDVEYKDVGDVDLLGRNATCRLYQTKDDRWIFVLCAGDKHWKDLCPLMDLEAIGADSRFESEQKRNHNKDVLIEILSNRFRQRTAEEWVNVLTPADIPVVPLQIGIMNDPHSVENNLFDVGQHPEFGPVKQVGLVLGFSGMTGIIRRPSPVFAQHTEEILSELGHSDEAIAVLVEQGVAFLPVEEEPE